MGSLWKAEWKFFHRRCGQVKFSQRDFPGVIHISPDIEKTNVENSQELYRLLEAKCKENMTCHLTIK